ncbi:hypothetical protein BGZ95_004996 [Linnemannia exigua]|uniref:Beta-lactamase/transpeptidase-like protein n=1 Tax=Linnemannia exigua TaxID=604196 RepID=A0AAD4D2F0_9FUNG|nr:hypothetical protein BGZ95_004996 [Linnemannia exigua]
MVQHRSPVPCESTFRQWATDIERARLINGIRGMSVAVMHKGKIIFAQGFGHRNENNDPFTAETIAPIASQTKAFTAAAIGELVAEGKMDWDKTPVSTYLPEFQLKDPYLNSQVTLADILSHRSGLQPDLNVAFLETAHSRRELIKRLRHLDVKYPLRTEFHYNNVCYIIAGEAAAQVAGMPYEDVVRVKVINPLALTNTGFSYQEMQTRPNYAMPYHAKTMEDAQQGKFIAGELDLSYQNASAAGFIYSNVLDLAIWAKTMMHKGELDGKQILNKESIKKIQTAHSIVPGDQSSDFGIVSAYGFGWGGSNSGFRSNAVQFPHADLAVVVLTNMHHAELTTHLPFYIADSVLGLRPTQDWLFDIAVVETREEYDNDAKSACGEQLPKQIKNKPSSRALEEYVGVYEHPVFGTYDVALKKGSGKEDGEKPQLVFSYAIFIDSPVEHYHYDTFRVNLTAFTLDEYMLISFVTDDDGTVSLRCNFYDFDFICTRSQKNNGSRLTV